MTEITDNEVLSATQVWLEKLVIGLNLCPFAKAVYAKNKIRYIVSKVSNKKTLLAVLKEELLLLKETPIEEVETTLLIHPYVLQDFFEYNEFLNTADELLEELELDGDIQIASFHPEYQFAEMDSDDIANYTNRSPFPMLHLLREESVDKAVEAFPEAEQIYEKNIDTMEHLGKEGLGQLNIPYLKINN